MCFAIDEQYTQIYLERERRGGGGEGGRKRERRGRKRERRGRERVSVHQEVYISSNKLRSSTPGFISPYTQERAYTVQ